MKRSELIFLYDIKDNNPNGDPLDANKPRIDEETGINFVTDVRLKRTTRDYLYGYKEQEIFVREIKNENDEIQDGKMRAKDFTANKKDVLTTDEYLDVKREIAGNVICECVDARLFGATIPIEFKVKKKE